MGTRAFTGTARPMWAVNMFAVFLGALGTANAASVAPPECSALLDTLFHSGPPTAKAASDALQPAQAAGCIWSVTFPAEKLPGLDRSIPAAIRAARKSSNVKQTGAQTGAGGTTSAITQPGTPLLSLATEYGGITSSTSNQTVTFQIPLNGIPMALVTNGTLPYCSTTLIHVEGCAQKSVLDFMGRFGFTVSMNTSTPANSVKATATGASQGTTQQVTATSQAGSTPSFSGASVKYTIIRPTAKLPTTAGAPTIQAANLEAPAVVKLNSFLKGSAYEDWQNCVADKLHASPNRKAADALLSQYFTQLKDILLSGMKVTGCAASETAAVATTTAGNTRPIDPKLLHDYVGAVVDTAVLTEANFDADINAALAAPILTFESDFSTPQNQQDYWTFKFVGSKSWAGPGGTINNNYAPRFTLTANAGASIFSTTPPSSVPGTTLLRSVQAGAEFDYVVPTSHLPGFLGKMGDSTAALAYYYQDQTSPSILNVTPGSPLPGITLVGLPSAASQIFTEAGHLNVAQFKYGFGTGKNVKFPIAVTYSSRTELIAHPTWGAQFGVSYDFSSLFGGGSGNSGGGSNSQGQQ
jgi:hypothetical protein